MLRHALSLSTPSAIRYPRGSTSGKHLDPPAPLVHGRAELLRQGSDVAILALGNTCDVALDAFELLEAEGIRPTVVNARFVKPLDEALLLALAEDHPHFLTLEEHSLEGGFGSAVVEFVSDRGLHVHVDRLGVSNELVHHDKQDKQRVRFGLSPETVAARVRSVTAALTS
jgi:1-deoxy-D-xylulose-5-phosphate synthase